MSTRRMRLALAAMFLAVLGTFAFASVAGAAEPGFESKEAEECHKLLEEGKKVDDCQEAPSPILPATNELIWGGISFVVLLLLLSKFAFPALKKGMDDRTERIRKDLDEAEGAKTEADRIREDYSRQLADAKAEAGRIIEEARQAADSVRRDLTARAETEAQELRQRNAEQLEAERTRIMGELRGQVSTLAIELAEKVVEANLDRDAQNRLIESYISQVGNR
jgi:F-type H+-transporting ATPase subunit b